MVHDANSSNTSFTMSKANTQALTADVFDTNGQYIKPILTWGSSANASATVATGTSGNNPATITAVGSGTAYITASCSYPDCNRNVAAQYSLNVATATVTGGVATTVYAASIEFHQPRSHQHFDQHGGHRHHFATPAELDRL